MDHVVTRALAKSPKDRYPDGESLAEDVDLILNGQPPRRRGGSPQPESPLASSRTTIPPESRGPAKAQAELLGLEIDAAVDRLVSESRTPELSALLPSPRPGPPSQPVSGPALPAAGAKPPRFSSGTRLAVGTFVAAAVVGMVLIARRAERRNPPPALSKPPAHRSIPSPEPPSVRTASRSAEARPATTGAAPRAPNRSAPSLAEQPTRLVIDLEHSLKTGTLRVWVDSELRLDKRLDSRVTKIVAVKLRKGSLEETVGLSPGRHLVRVQVTWNDNEKSETLAGTFAPGATRRLEARVGRLRKNLSLEWK